MFVYSIENDTALNTCKPTSPLLNDLKRVTNNNCRKPFPIGWVVQELYISPKWLDLSIVFKNMQSANAFPLDAYTRIKAMCIRVYMKDLLKECMAGLCEI